MNAFLANGSTSSSSQEEATSLKASKGKEPRAIPTRILFPAGAVLLTAIALIWALRTDSAERNFNLTINKSSDHRAYVQAAPPKKMINMLVARWPLEMGQLVKDPKELFSVLPVEKGKEPANAYTETDIEDLKNRRLVNRLAKGQAVFPEDLVDKNKNSLGIGQPKGMRAVGIKVDIVSGPVNFANLPMSRVDIVSTIRRNDGSSMSQVILKDVLVVAVGSDTVRSGDKNAMPTNVVTVALTPEDAELVALAQEVGTLRLTLRPDEE